MQTTASGGSESGAGYVFRPAHGEDASAVAELVDAAYRHYVPRIGMVPMPMRADYRQVIADADVTVAISSDSSEIAGVLVVADTPDGFLVENVAVHPSHQRRGLGRALLGRANEQALRTGAHSVYLYTHELMTENIALYQRLGYVEYERRDEGGFFRVFLRKRLSTTPGEGLPTQSGIIGTKGA